MDSGVLLRDFVAALFGKEGQVFNEASLTAALRSLLQEVRLVQRSGLVFRLEEQLKLGPPKLGACRYTARDLLPLVQSALSKQGGKRADAMGSAAALEVLQSPAWQSLYELLGDGHFLKLFTNEIYLHLPPGSRWLQLAGQPSQLNNFISVAQAPQKRWSPASIFVERRIFYSCRFAARAGLPLRGALRRTPADRAGAESLVSWMLGPRFFVPAGGQAVASVPGPLDMPPAANRQERRRRGPRKRTDPMPLPKQAQRPGPWPASSSSQRFTRPVFDALLQPVLGLLHRTSEVKFQAILRSSCPAKHSMMILKIFEASNPKRRRLPRGQKLKLSGLRCFCSREGLSQGDAHTCTGGDAEIHFMKNFPAVSCAQHPAGVARFLISSLLQLLGGSREAADLLGSPKNS